MLAAKRIPSHEVVPPEPVPAGVRRSAHYFPEIESLRGIAILLVFFFHANPYVRPPGDPAGSRVSLPWAFVAGGATGVSLFFVLSGFLLSLPFIAEAAGRKRVRRLDYYARRALRILPLYYAAVLVGTLLSAHTLADLLRGVPYLFFLNSFALNTPLHPYSDVWWSLSTEVQFYLVLPLLPLFLRSRAGRWSGMAVVCAYSIFLLALLTGRIPLQSLRGASAAKLSLVGGRGFAFLFGGVAAWIYFHYGERARERLARMRVMANAGADAALIVTLAGLGLLLRWQVFFGYWNAEAGLPHLYHVAEGFLWAGVVLLLLLAPVRMKPIFCNSALGTVGILSYSFYIVHLPLLRLWFAWLAYVRPGFVGRSIEAFGALVVLLCACLALSALTYRVIERPFLRRKARIDR